MRQSAVALPRVTRGADFWGRLLFPLLYTLSDYAIDTDSLRNPGTAQLLILRFASWTTCFSRCRVRLLPTGQTPTGWDDQTAVAVHMRTYDEAIQPSQSRHACRTQGVRLQPFLPIPMGDVPQIGEADEALSEIAPLIVMLHS